MPDREDEGINYQSSDDPVHHRAGSDEPVPIRPGNVPATQDQSGVPKPTPEQFAAFEAEGNTRKINFVMRRFALVFPELPETARNKFLAAIRISQQMDDPALGLERLLTDLGNDQLHDVYKLSLQFAARTLTWAEIRAEAPIDPVIAWSLAKSKARQGDTRSTEVEGWLAWLGPIAESIVNMGSTAGEAVRRAGGAVGSGLGAMLSEVLKNPFLLGVIALAIYLFMRNKGGKE